jgi:uncharacterized protein
MIAQVRMNFFERYCSFFKSLLIACFCLPFIACATNGGIKADSHKNGRVRIIDAHTHAVLKNTPEGMKRPIPSKEEYLKEMAENNVVGAVSHTRYPGEYDEELSNRNIVFCYGIGDKVNEKEIEHGLKSGQYGCIKIYLGYIHRYASDKEYEPVYSLAEKYGVPVVFHTGDTYDVKAKLKYADPMTVDEVAVDHPKVRFVLAHCGNPWINTAAELAYKNPNVYLDVSGFLIGDLNRMSGEDIDVYMIQPIKWIFGYVENQSKILYGSDWPLVNMGQYINAVKKAIPEENWKAVFYENAMNVFKLKVNRLEK